MRKLFWKWILNMVAFVIAASLLPGIRIQSPEAVLGAGVVLGLANLIIRPVLLLLTIPINFLTLGLFTLVINTLMVLGTDYVVQGLMIDGFVTAFIVSLIVSGLSIVLGDLGGRRDRRR